jgi:predicted metalloprotease
MALGAGGGLAGLVVVVLVMLLGGNSGDSGIPIDDIIGQLENPAPAGNQAQPGPDPDDRLVDFMSFVLDDSQRFWRETLEGSNRDYRDAKLVLFTQSTNSACGGATAAIGPHYCPADEKIYLDLDFFRELRDGFGAPGDFAQAYVLAHEVAHHVQNVLGINDQVQRAQQQGSADANELSIRLELQADCFAGVWGYTTYTRDLLESGDLEEGLNAAAAVGDDRIQQESGGRVNPETWTHGSSAQRVEWFRRGFDSGDPSRCDTFAD